MSDSTITSPPPALPEITPAATKTLEERQEVVTLSITASSSPTATAASKKSFPIAVAIPALVGGMALAIGAFLLYWFIAKRRRREKRLRWERHQRRMQRQRSAPSSRRPSASASRPNNGPKSPIDEKGFVPPVPALPKHAAQQSRQQGAQYKPEQGYGYQHHEQVSNYAPQQYDQSQYASQHYDQQAQYAPQPSIEQTHQPLHDPYRSDGSSAPAAAAASVTDETTPQSKPKKSSKSAARVAAAEKAAEAAHGDINTRYQPKKPSPLALKAQEKQAGDVGGPKWGDGPFRSGPSHPSQLEIPGQNTDRQVSGEWGVALGSPLHDQPAQVGYGASYANDPYLNTNDSNTRGKSGVYSNDPYSAYHGEEEEIDYHQVARNQGLDGKKMNWV